MSRALHLGSLYTSPPGFTMFVPYIQDTDESPREFSENVSPSAWHSLAQPSLLNPLLLYILSSMIKTLSRLTVGFRSKMPCTVTGLPYALPTLPPRWSSLQGPSLSLLCSLPQPCDNPHQLTVSTSILSRWLLNQGRVSVFVLYTHDIFTETSWLFCSCAPRTILIPR